MMAGTSLVVRVVRIVQLSTAPHEFQVASYVRRASVTTVTQGEASK